MMEIAATAAFRGTHARMRNARSGSAANGEGVDEANPSPLRSGLLDVIASMSHRRRLL